MNDRESKLPKWAQDELHILRRKLAEVAAEAATLRGDTPSLVYVQSWNDFTVKNYLGDHSRVTFKTATGDISCFIREGKLDVSCDGTILTEHAASNCFRVRVQMR